MDQSENPLISRAAEADRKVVYLMPVSALEDRKAQERYLPLVEEARRRKVLACKRPQDRAHSLGAGLLLQYGILRWRQEYGFPKYPEKGEEGSAEGWASPREILSGSVKCTERDGEGLETVVWHLKDDGSCLWRPVSWEEVSESILHADTCFRLKTEESPSGKPYLADIPLCCSLSHSGGYAACGISTRELGVDLQEERTGRLERLAERFFLPQEAAWVKEGIEEREISARFYRLWTKKESCGKLVGTGLRGMLTTGESLHPGEITKQGETQKPGGNFQPGVPRESGKIQENQMPQESRESSATVSRVGEKAGKPGIVTAYFCGLAGYIAAASWYGEEEDGKAFNLPEGL